MNRRKKRLNSKKIYLLRASNHAFLPVRVRFAWENTYFSSRNRRGRGGFMWGRTSCSPSNGCARNLIFPFVQRAFCGLRRKRANTRFAPTIVPPLSPSSRMQQKTREPMARGFLIRNRAYTSTSSLVCGFVAGTLAGSSGLPTLTRTCLVTSRCKRSGTS